MTGRNLEDEQRHPRPGRCTGARPLREEIAHREYVEKIIDFLEIQHVRKMPVGQLP